MIRNLLRRRPAPHAAFGGFAFCEPVTASTYSAVHLRPLDHDGIRYVSGGLRATALCGRSITSGWDLNRTVTAAAVIAELALPAGSANPLCARCAEQYLHAAS